jgi:hypothetical protein
VQVQQPVDGLEAVDRFSSHICTHARRRESVLRKIRAPYGAVELAGSLAVFSGRKVMMEDPGGFRRRPAGTNA